MRAAVVRERERVGTALRVSVKDELMRTGDA